MNKFHLQKGYSLMELLIYIAIFIAISVVIIQALVLMMRTYTSAVAYRRLQTNGEIIMERIIRETRSADSINIVSSVFGSHPGVLTVQSTDEDSVAHTVTFSIASGALQIDDNGSVGNLSSSEIVIDALIFRRFTTNSSEGVKVELTISTANGLIVSAPFYSSIVLRDN